jgi:hypothetical protein
VLCWSGVRVSSVQFFCELGRLVCWSYGVMVSTLDSESSDPGSNPGRTSFILRYPSFRTPSYLSYAATRPAEHTLHPTTISTSLRSTSFFAIPDRSTQHHCLYYRQSFHTRAADIFPHTLSVPATPSTQPQKKKSLRAALSSCLSID